MTEMLINKQDASTFGVRMGDGFLDAICTPLPLKEFVENSSRLEDGKRVLYNSPKIDERDVTLTFNIHGDTEEEFTANKATFEQILYSGKVEIHLPVTGKTYRLTYLRSQSYSQNIARTSCSVSVKFNEPNPINREANDSSILL